MILVTGGAGFIGLNFVKYLRDRTDESIMVFDAFRYAAHMDAPKIVPNVTYKYCDISDFNRIRFLTHNKRFSTIFHFAAETHVDNSIESVTPFIESNIIGTVNIIKLALMNNARLIHISTDEVFGQVEEPYYFNENSQIDPRNPYSASKASAEHFVRAYHNTSGLQYNIINSSNNYGPYQHKEKLIPKTITNFYNNQPITLYGSGEQVRDWIYVEDTCTAIHAIYERGKINERYCIGAEDLYTNNEIVRKIAGHMRKSFQLITYGTDRPGHDERYATSADKLQAETGWKPTITIDEGLKRTIDYYE